jgi:hypothetical protein
LGMLWASCCGGWRRFRCKLPSSGLPITLADQENRSRVWYYIKYVQYKYGAVHGSMLTVTIGSYPEDPAYLKLFVLILFGVGTSHEVSLFVGGDPSIT